MSNNDIRKYLDAMDNEGVTSQEKAKLNESMDIVEDNDEGYADQLSEIALQMEDLLEEAIDIVRGSDPHTYRRAEGYWIAQMEAAIGRGSNPATVSMMDTIRDLNGGEEY